MVLGNAPSDVVRIGMLGELESELLHCTVSRSLAMPAIKASLTSSDSSASPVTKIGV